MPDLDDATTAALRTMDPAIREEPPAPGSARYEEILRRAMSGTPVVPARRVPVFRRPMAWTAVTTAVAASVLAVVALGGTGGTLSPHSPVASSMTAHDALLLAADTTAEVNSLRATGTMVHEDGARSTSEVEVSGGDYHSVWRIGTVSVASYTIGDTFYERASDDPVLRTGKTTPESDLAPFGESTGAVVRTALRGTEVQSVGREQVRGATTTHYRLTMNAASRDALGRLPAGQAAWFNLEHPEDITAIDVWVAGDLIHRIRVEGRTPSTTEFYDFGAPITIATPPGF
ncbi:MULTISPECIES: hypothetical protein [Catenuloplanes]|uniref:Uncharacterized protein n=1 Tax=Catenuloplanes niger TaxID=587534 RepID=A0AAE3ZPM4_9ACTN|nr:hypothetical protein [Catenuloplanes niger]MDR7322581.1 hypothetical protein [Catenuloplanes niger]